MMKKEAAKAKQSNIFRTYKVQSLDNIIDFEHNSRTHSEEQIQEVVDSINEFGYTNPILVDEKNVIIAGHCRVAGAKRAGLTEIPTIIVDGLTDVQKAALVIADNKLALNAGWDFTKLAHQITFLRENDYNTDLTGFKADEIASFMPDEVPAFDGDEDAIPEAPEEPITKLGDLWVLGKHRLLCGNSTMVDDVEKLMAGEKADMVFTDPPYGVNVVGGRTQTAKRDNIQKIENDDLKGVELEQFIRDALSLVPMKNNSSFYVCYDHKTQYEFTSVLKQIQWRQKNTIIWNKNNFGLGVKGYRPKFEMIAFGHVGESYDWFGGNDQADVWDIARVTERHGNHPTPKPVEVIEKAIINSSKKNMLVVDVFGGSGSTLIACEKTNRKCYMMELSPIYCDVIIARWEKLTKKKAKLETSDGTGS